MAPSYRGLPFIFQGALVVGQIVISQCDPRTKMPSHLNSLVRGQHKRCPIVVGKAKKLAFFFPELHQLHDGFDGCLHILHGHPFFPGVEGMASGE